MATWSESTQRVVRAVLSAAVMLVLLAGLLAVTARRQVVEEESRASGLAPPGSIGPLPGEALPAYVAASKQVLAAIDGKRAAAVSFDRYVREVDARRVATGLQLRGFLVAGRGGGASFTTDLARWAEEERAAAEKERAETLKVIPTLDPKADADFLRQYRADVERLTKLIESARPDADVVFGIVVVADADRLRTLGRTGGVRLVDVGANDEVPDGDRVRGLLPDEKEKADDPPTRPF